jgi:hypothetical protein
MLLELVLTHLPSGGEYELEFPTDRNYQESIDRRFAGCVDRARGRRDPEEGSVR